jgi:hypothetical protein
MNVPLWLWLLVVIAWMSVCAAWLVLGRAWSRHWHREDLRVQMTRKRVAELYDTEVH